MSLFKKFGGRNSILILSSKSKGGLEDKKLSNSSFVILSQAIWVKGVVLLLLLFVFSFNSGRYWFSSLFISLSNF